MTPRSLDEIDEAIKAAHLLRGVHNTFTDYLPATTTLDPDVAARDLANLSAITVAATRVVTAQDVEAGRDSTDDLGATILTFERVSRRDEAGEASARWSQMLDALADPDALDEPMAAVAVAVGPGADMEISVTPLKVRDQWFGLGATATRPRQLDNAMSAGMSPLAPLNRMSAELGFHTVLTDNQLAGIRVILGMCPLGLQHWTTMCAQLHPGEVTWTI